MTMEANIEQACRRAGRWRRMLLCTPLLMLVASGTLLCSLGCAGLFTALEGMVRATIWIPIGFAFVAMVSAVLLRRVGSGGRVRQTARALVAVNTLFLMVLSSCVIFAPFSAAGVRVPAGDHALAGTLYLPSGDGPHPAVVLVHGSTRQTRDSLGGLYRTNAIALARRGIAALVYDKRGCGESTGNFDTALMPEFASDARAAVSHLRSREDIDADRVGLWGISAGGWVAPMAAAANPEVAFVVLVSAPAVPEADQRLFEWAKAIRADGASEDYIASALTMRRQVWAYYASSEGWEQLSDDLEGARKQLWWSSIRAAFPNGVAPPDAVRSAAADNEFRWHRTDCFRDPIEVLSRVEVPVLAIYGSDDSNIDIDRNVPLMRRALAVRSDGFSQLLMFEGAGHGLLGRRIPPLLAAGYTEVMANWVEDTARSTGRANEGENGGDEMTDAKTLARHWIEVWAKGDPKTLPLADDFCHTSPFGKLEGRAKYLEVVMPLAAKNVASLEIDEIIGEGDRACVAFTMKTPQGSVACCDWITASGGEIKSVQSYYDTRDIPNFEKY